ncbi:MAG: GNAT family N-acetyltransferase [Betaproteobacteria bacterium]|nr:GNAT family N-acetyltransferase [Betaproteobacteria bacterium]
MSVVTRELTRAERGALERHLLALDAEDRRLRFGVALADQAVRDYAARIDFSRDAVFGVFDDDLRLIGAAHLARAEGYAELGVSVLPGQRDRGMGGALLERARIHARNWGIRTLFVHCLAENGAMLHLARRQGMRVATEAGEADAYLDLAPADPASIAAELLAERVGLFDFALKSQFLAARRLTDALMRPASGAGSGPGNSRE